MNCFYVIVGRTHSFAQLISMKIHLVVQASTLNFLELYLEMSSALVGFWKTSKSSFIIYLSLPPDLTIAVHIYFHTLQASKTLSYVHCSHHSHALIFPYSLTLMLGDLSLWFSLLHLRYLFWDEFSIFFIVIDFDKFIVGLHYLLTNSLLNCIIFIYFLYLENFKTIKSQ